MSPPRERAACTVAGLASLVALAALAPAACSIPDSTFVPSDGGGGGDGGPDAPVLKSFGWPPPPFSSSTLFAQGSVTAYKITLDAATTQLDAFGVYTPAGAGYYRMALYRDAGNAPGALVAQMAAPVVLQNGANRFDLLPDAAVDTTLGLTYWIALRLSQNTALAYSTTSTGTQCFRSQDVPNINDPWPTSFGAATCQSDYLVNLWVELYAP